MLEKNLFHIWFQGCDTITQDKFKINIKNWKLMNPDWNYKCYNNNDLQKTCYQFSKQCGQAYDKAKEMHTKIDLGKMTLVYNNGGMSLDMDQYALRPLSYSKEIQNLLTHPAKHIIAFTKGSNSPIANIIYVQNTTFYNNAIVIATKGNPILKDWINTMIHNIETISPNIKDTEYVFKTTGPYCYNKFIQKNINRNDSVIISLPPQVFEPCNQSGQCNITDSTISLHQYELTWIGKSFRSCIVYLPYLYWIPLIIVLGYYNIPSLLCILLIYFTLTYRTK